LLMLLVVLPASAQESDVRFWYGPRQYFGQQGETQRWINVLGNVGDADRLQSLVYRLNGGAPTPLTIGGDLHRLALPGDFNVELTWESVRTGENDLVVIATYDDGRVAESETNLVVEKGNKWPLPYSVAFAEVDTLQKVVEIIDGHWELTADGARTVTPYYDRVIGMGDTTWTDFEALVRLTVHGFTPSEPGPPTYNVTHFGVAMRWRGHHEDEYQPNRKWYPMGSQGELLLQALPDSSRYRILFGSEHPTVVGQTKFPVALEQERWVRTQNYTLPDGQTLYRFKTWPVGESEPLHWQAEGTEPDSLDYASGSLLIVPHNSDVTIHEVSATPITRWSTSPAARPGPGALHRSAPVGGVMGAVGEPFEIELFPSQERLHRVRVNVGDEPMHLIKGVAFEIVTAGGELEVHSVGSDTGTWEAWYSVPAGSTLTGISGASGWFIDGLRFHFSDGSMSPRYGGTYGDTEFHVELRSGEEGIGRLRGLYGTVDDGLIETLGLIFDPAFTH
jgi:hypothetical protein